MSTVVECSAKTKKGTNCNYKAKYSAFCRHHCPKDQVTLVVKKAKVTKLPKISLLRLSPAKANQLSEENNILLWAVADKIGLNVEEVLCPITNTALPMMMKTLNQRRRERMRSFLAGIRRPKK